MLAQKSQQARRAQVPERVPELELALVLEPVRVPELALVPELVQVPEPVRVPELALVPHRR